MTTPHTAHTQTSETKAIGQRLRQFRGETPLRDFAKRIGVSHGFVVNIEQGRREPGKKFLDGLRAAFPALNADWLLSGIGPMQNAKAVAIEAARQLAASLRDHSREECLDAIAVLTADIFKRHGLDFIAIKRRAINHPTEIEVAAYLADDHRRGALTARANAPEVPA